MISLIANALKWCYRSAGKLLIATALLWAAIYLRGVLAARDMLPEKLSTYQALVEAIETDRKELPDELTRLKQIPRERIRAEEDRVRQELGSFESKSSVFSSPVEAARRKVRVTVLTGELKYLKIVDGSTRDLDALRADHRRAYDELAKQFPIDTPASCPAKPGLLDFSKRTKLIIQLCKANAEAYEKYLARKESLLSRQADAIQDRLSKLLTNSEREIDDLQAKAESFLSQQTTTVKDAFFLALKGFIALLILPLLIRAFFFFVVAPAASRRAPIRLLPGTSGELSWRGGADNSLTAPASASSVSIALPVSPTDELLVHPEYLQSSPSGARMDTRLLFSARYPLTSIASGLMGVTRIRTTDTETFVVSATTQGELIELAAISIPPGGAVVLQPRCLVGVLQRRDRPARITSHWRLGSLSAWLTLQLRYLVFHGPATVILKGCRGVRVEPAVEGRLINQAATLGFSANLQYSTTRAEPFFPYLTGRRPLFDDRFAGSNGYYIYEESTGYGRAANPVRRQFEGLSDALLKVFGI